MQDLGGWQDDHAENDVEESQRGGGQDAPAGHGPFEQELLLRIGSLSNLANIWKSANTMAQIWKSANSF